MTGKKARITCARLMADGTLRRIRADGAPGAKIRPRIDRARLDSPAAFAPDADTPVLTARALKSAARPGLKRTRAG